MEKKGKEEKNMSKKRDLSPDAKIRFGEHLAYGIGGLQQMRLIFLSGDFC